MASWQEQIAAAHAEVIGEIRQKLFEATNGTSAFEGFKAFTEAVDWAEPWIVTLLTIHALVLLAVIIFRRNNHVQSIVFFTSMILVYSAQYLNAWAMTHWKSFARQNYFEPRGMFISVMLSLPLVVIMFAVLINYIIEMVVLMVEMKKKELQYKARQRKKVDGRDGAGVGGDTKKTK